MPDADRDSTAKGLLASSMGSAGQRCMAASVAVGVADIDPIIKQLVEEAKAFELGIDMGTIISRSALDRIKATLMMQKKWVLGFWVDGGESNTPTGYENGYWLGVTVWMVWIPIGLCQGGETLVRSFPLSERNLGRCYEGRK
ncbi:MAG: hypothetical protein Ct9H300mP9_0630 [Candidatus Neomarinimicrobiota bacterium]|nr:MAG: hypothetical protein Ct9H300mP9_0630 [Candidatus Neomarinimicrobiota bacterium]